MGSLFDKHGHISEYGMELLLKEEASEIECLEASEHLSFCDECFEKYLLEIDAKVKKRCSTEYEIMVKRIKRNALPVILKRITSVATAACLAIILLFAGYFDKGVYPMKFFVFSVNRIAKSYMDFIENANEMYTGANEKIKAGFNRDFMEVFYNGE